MAETEPGVSSWLAAYVDEQFRPEILDGWVERVQGPVLERNPEVADDPVLARLIRPGIKAHWISFLTSLRDPSREFHLVDPAAELAVELAQRGLSPTVLFRVYRVAQQAVWEYATTVTEAVRDSDAEEAEVLVYFWNRASAWLDASVEASVELFQATADRRRQGAAAQRLDAVREALDNADLDLRELSARLGGYPLSGHNTALLLHTGDNDAIADLETASGRLGQTVGVRNPLVVKPGGRDLWCWLGTRDAVDLDALHDCSDWLRERRIQVAVGSPATGLAGFQQSHQEAVVAQRLAFAMRTPAPVTLHRDVELVALVASDHEAARRFTLRTLGALAEAGDGPARLRQTLHALLDKGSVDAAAQELMVHKNTVRYRVGQAEAALGHPVAQPTTELELALRYYELFLADPPG